jgi:hypothetical protein
MSRGRGVLAAGWVAVLVLGACSSKAPANATSAPPGAEGGGGREERADEVEKTEAAGAEAGEADEELPALDARVDEAWRELRELDQQREKAGVIDSTAAAARCDRIRGLADEICTLSDRMCTLASEHPGERRYAVACARSQETCSSARQAVERCPAV